MITVEIKINGTLIAHLYCRNVTSFLPINRTGKDKVSHLYDFEYYKIGVQEVRIGKVWHVPSDGALKLIAKIIKAILRKPQPDDIDTRKI